MKNNWLQKTNQYWKILIFYILLIFSSIFFILFIFSINYLQNIKIQLFFTAVFALSGLMPVIWLALSIKCPNCHKHVAYFFISKTSFSSWLEELHNLDVCPFCSCDKKKTAKTNLVLQKSGSDFAFRI